MTVTATPAFPQTPNSGATAGALATANTNYTTPTNTVTIFTAGSNGSDVTAMGAIVYATNTAATVDFFKKNGSNYLFIGSVLIGANTVSTTASKPMYACAHLNGGAITPSNPIRLVSGDTIIATTSVTQSTFQAYANGQDY